MDHPLPRRDLDVLSLDELLLTAVYYHLIDSADRIGDEVHLCVGNQQLAVAEDEARTLLVRVLIRRQRLAVTPPSSASQNQA